jgi:hypothetical protein
MPSANRIKHILEMWTKAKRSNRMTTGEASTRLPRSAPRRALPGFYPTAEEYGVQLVFPDSH